MKRLFGFFSILSMLILLAGCATTLLMNAAVGGDVNAVKKLLNEGADVNVQGFNGWTALSEAAYGGHTKIVKLLIDKGADIDGAIAYFEGRSDAHSIAGAKLIERMRPKQQIASPTQSQGISKEELKTIVQAAV